MRANLGRRWKKGAPCSIHEYTPVTVRCRTQVEILFPDSVIVVQPGVPPGPDALFYTKLLRSDNQLQRVSSHLGGIDKIDRPDGGIVFVDP